MTKQEYLEYFGGSFDGYNDQLDEFYNKFFPNVDMDKLKSKYEKELNEKNVELL